MYIAPSSDIYLISGIKFDNSYRDTIYFDTASAQNTYFMSKVRYHLDNNSYVRKTRGKLKVGLPIGQIYGINYMAFRNPDFENKWFYAFVNDYEMVNNETTELSFEIDLIQTYMFDYSLYQCMVQRHHTTDDTVGANLVPENLDTGEYVFDESISQNDNKILWDGAWDICIFTTLNNDGSAQSSVDGTIMGGLYSGLNLHRFSTSQIADVNDYLTHVSQCGAETSVVAIVMLPAVLLDLNTDVYLFNVPRGDKQGELKTYTPRNKKLLTAPFYGIYATNGQGAVASYNFEDFIAPEQVTFSLAFSLGVNADCMLQPLNYRGNARQYGLELTGFPQCAYTTDAYKAWLARNGAFLALNQTELQLQSAYATQQAQFGLTSAGIQNDYAQRSAGYNMLGSGLGMLSGIIMGAVTANPLAIVGSIASGIGGMANTGLSMSTSQRQYENTAAQTAAQKAYINQSLQLGIQRIAAQKHAAALTPPSFHGQSVGSANKLNGDFGYHVGEYRIKQQFAQRIDDYFDMFGYAQDVIYLPMRKVRAAWTYVQTAAGNFDNRTVPEDDMSAIISLYNSGIRFWVDGDKIGDYNQNNDILPNADRKY